MYYNRHPECELPYSSDFTDKQGVQKLMVIIIIIIFVYF